MTPWHCGALALFDLETTGVDPHEDRIVTAAVILAGQHYDTVERAWLLQTVIDIPQGATDVHGITTEHAREHGIAPTDGVRSIATALLGLVDGGAAIVGHNVSYDLTMLHAECVRHGLDDLAERVRTVRPVVDTMVCDKAVDRFRRGSRKLVDVARHYGVTLSDDDAHGAAADALAAGRVAWKMAARFPELQVSGEQIHDLQVAWKREQAESFGAYLVRQGKVDDVSRAWPISPRAEAVAA